MYAVERQQWLVEHARDFGRLDVNVVAKELEVARETVRRDLRILERQGLVRRVHGGAIPVERLGFEGALEARRIDRSEAKARIAQHASSMLGSAETVYIDEGSTCQALAEQFSPVRPLTVITNALPVAMLMAPKPHVSVVLLGGHVRARTLGTIDHWAVRMLQDLVIDLAFLGTNGITLDRGLTCPDAAVAAVKSEAVRQSRESVLLCDGAKFGVDSSYRFAAVSSVSAIVTDRSVRESTLKKLRGSGVEVVVV